MLTFIVCSADCIGIKNKTSDDQVKIFLKQCGAKWDEEKIFWRLPQLNREKFLDTVHDYFRDHEIFIEDIP